MQPLYARKDFSNILTQMCFTVKLVRSFLTYLLCGMFLSVESCCIAMSLPVGVVFFYNESDSVDANKLESFEQVLYVYFVFCMKSVSGKYTYRIQTKQNPTLFNVLLV